jgi:hypothetical protein
MEHNRIGELTTDSVVVEDVIASEAVKLSIVVGGTKLLLSELQ